MELLIFPPTLLLNYVLKFSRDAIKRILLSWSSALCFSLTTQINNVGRNVGLFN